VSAPGEPARAALRPGRDGHHFWLGCFRDELGTVFPALRARSLLIPLRRLVQSPRRTIAVMDLAAGVHVLVMGVESKTQPGLAALHRLLIRFPGHLERPPGPQRAFAPGAAGNAAPLG
jgi:hypothetical protein